MSLSETLRVFPARSFEVAPDKSIGNSGKYQHVEKKPKASFKAAVIYISILTSCFTSHSFIGLVPSHSSHCFQQSCTDGFSQLDGTCCSASHCRQSPTLAGKESEHSAIQQLKSWIFSSRVKRKQTRVRRVNIELPFITPHLLSV